MRPALHARVIGAALLLLALSAGCESLIGLDDRHLADGGAAAEPTAVSKRAPEDVPSAAECDAYCSSMLGADGGAAACSSSYRSLESCRAVCGAMSRGTPGDDPIDPTSGDYDTLTCRTHYAQVAAREPGKAVAACMAAGPSGEGTPGCGTACENYCGLFAVACPNDKQSQDIARCVDRCAALRDYGRFDAIGGIDTSGNSVQCRLLHTINALGAASAGAAELATHCGRAAIKSSDYCLDKPGDPASCENYCQLTSVACKGDQTLYESPAQCLATCRALDPGDAPNQGSGNTLSCRQYHGVNSLLGSDTHCGHAGLGGGQDRACGDECASYCRLASAACGAGFAAAFPGADPKAACLSSCAALPGATQPASYMGYTLALGKSALGKGDSLPCRLYFTAKALEDPATAPQHCPSVFGAGSCASR